jgi:hypothetical protein
MPKYGIVKSGIADMNMRAKDLGDARDLQNVAEKGA